MSIVYDSKIVVSRYKHLRGRLVCYTYPNIAEIARRYEIPIHQFCARLQGRQSRTEWSATNRSLSADQELAVCQYLHRLDVICTCARMQIVTSYANRILHNTCTGPTPVPLVSEQWAPRFLARNPLYHIRKQQAIETYRKHAHEPNDLRHWFAKCLAIC